ncbi:MAG: restriction endonuclease [Alphaproteobacteria bacterium]|nr:restriction endonuclease [Alphaproteobacteria bacterium]
MDKPIIDKVFGMEGGYVLDFTNRTFAAFFREELGIDIDAPRWTAEGNSKAKRLHYFLRQADRQTGLSTLKSLWEYRETSGIATDYPELGDSVRAAFFRIVERLGGELPAQEVPFAAHRERRIDAAAIFALAADLVEISRMEPQARGYEFEKFLRNVFDAYEMSARASFRNRGEQIDGSFVHDGNTYLLEARWRDAPVAVETLRAFDGKVRSKPNWTRGLIISQSGFTKDGLHAFGSGNRVLCMDGADLYEVLNHRLDLAEVIALKARRAAETGAAFVRVRELNLPIPK